MSHSDAERSAYKRPTEYWCNDDEQVRIIERALDMYEASLLGRATMTDRSKEARQIAIAALRTNSRDVADWIEDMERILAALQSPAPSSASSDEILREALQKIADDYPRLTNEGAQKWARDALAAAPQASASSVPQADAAANDAPPKAAKGETYVGGYVAPDGKVTHVFLLPGEFDGNWTDAMAWAKKAGGDLPNRIEQSLLWAHHAKHFQKRYYWSNEQLAEASSDAWTQGFGLGTQGLWRKGLKNMARAVRRVVV